MAVSYNRLWKLLVDKKMSKADLRKASGVAPNTMTKLRRDEKVTLTVLGKICKTLNADYGDIMEYVDEEGVPAVPRCSGCSLPQSPALPQGLPPATLPRSRWIQIRFPGYVFPVLLSNHGSADYHTLNLIGSLKDLEDLRVANEFFYRILTAVTVTAQNLYGIDSGLHHRITCEAFGCC